MKKIIVNGYEVTTNYGAMDYPFSDGNGKSTMSLQLLKFRETDKDALERLAPQYSKITFYRTRTSVRGFYETVAYCKRREDNEMKETTNTEKAVQIIVSDIRKTIDEDYSDWGIESWKEMLHAFGMDNGAEFKDEVFYILTHSDIDGLAFTDDCEIMDATVPSGITSYRGLMARVRHALGW